MNEGSTFSRKKLIENAAKAKRDKRINKSGFKIDFRTGLETGLLFLWL